MTPRVHLPEVGSCRSMVVLLALAGSSIFIVPGDERLFLYIIDCVLWLYVGSR